MLDILPAVTTATLRALLIVMLCLPAALWIRPILGGRQPARLSLWALLLLPCLTPALLTGYGYYNYSLSLIHHPALNELLYTLLVALRVLPVAVVILCFVPTAMQPSAAHCRRLLESSATALAGRRIIDELRGQATALTIAGVAVFLLAFGEFDMASLMMIKSWTVALFDNQAGGIPLATSLRLAALPFAIRLAALVLAFAVVLRAELQPHVSPAPRDTGRRGPVTALIVSALIVTGFPALVVLRGIPQGLGTVFSNFAIGGELLASVVFAAGATVLAWLAARHLTTKRSAGAIATAVILSAIGLLGPLLLGLLLVALFQTRALRPLYDSPLPLLIALTLLLFPFAVLLRLAFDAFSEDSPVHTARLLGAQGREESGKARQLLWVLHGSREFWAAFILFTWAYSNVIAAAMLAPTWATPVFVRLYNFMHYTQTAVLSTMVCIVIAVPLLLLAIGAGSNGLVARWCAK